MKEDYLTGPDADYLPWCDELWKQLVPHDLTHPATSRQGQLLVAAFTLAWEVRNAGANWDDKPELYAACESFVSRHLCDGTFDSQVCAFVEGAFAELHQWMDRESQDYERVYNSINQVETLTYHWCRLHPVPIAPEQVKWESAEPGATADWPRE
jgi:hypothetical protein